MDNPESVLDDLSVEQFEEFWKDKSTPAPEAKPATEPAPTPTPEPTADTPSATPPALGEPAVPPATPTATAATPPAATTTPAAPTSDDPLERRYTFRGQTKTMREWMAEGLETVFTNANQSAHFQELHRKRQQDDEAAKARAAATPKPFDPAVVKGELDVMKRDLVPRVTEIAKAIGLETDFIEDNPGWAGIVASLYLGNQNLTRQLSVFTEAAAQAAAARQARADEDHLARVIHDAGDVAAFAGLREPEQQRGFFQWLADDANQWGRVFANVDVAQLTPELIRGLYGHFMMATGQVPRSATPAPTPAPPAAAGEGGGGRQASKPSASDVLSVFDQEMRAAGLVS